MDLLRSVIRGMLKEAIGDRTWPGDKPHLICWVLARSSTPMTRPEVMQKVHGLEGYEPGELGSDFKSTSNRCYWAPATMIRGDSYEPDPDRGHGYRPVNPHEVPNDVQGASRYSVLIRGWVKKAGKKGKQFTYELTPEGQKLADECDAWMKSRPDLFGGDASDDVTD